MAIRKRLVASLGAAALAGGALLAFAPSASADVGDVDVTYYNAQGLVVGTDQDVFANLTSSQCDANQVPADAVSMSITNLTDETVTGGTSCTDGWIVVGPGQTFSGPVFGGSQLDIDAPAGL